MKLDRNIHSRSDNWTGRCKVVDHFDLIFDQDFASTNSKFANLEYAITTTNNAITTTNNAITTTNNAITTTNNAINNANILSNSDSFPNIGITNLKNN